MVGLAHRGEHARMDLRRARAHQGALRRVEGMDAFRRGELIHGVTPCQGWSEQAVFFTARLHFDRFARVGFVEHLGGRDLSPGGVLDLHGPARGHVAGLDPVADYSPVDPESARHLGLAAEDGDETLGAVH
ncbi:MAG: hypothetical protein MZW92_77930 [Comamonadaceae bacterium]|nr:hypothetical protein [Comamonadaceae bacterium]